MNNEKDELIQMLGKIITVNNIKNEIIKIDIICGVFEFKNNIIKSYIIGYNSTENIKQFEGKIISITEDKENGEKRVIVADRESKLTYFYVTGYFHDVTELKNVNFRCLFEKSAGAIIYKKINGEPYYLVIYNKNNFSGFPKGHVEYGETEECAAKREVLEEVGLKVKLENNFRESISYTVSNTPIQKEVVLFLAEVSENEKVYINVNEIINYKFVTYNEAKSLLSEELMDILDVAKEFIDNK